MGTVPLDRPLPIAIVIPTFEPGGTERQMTELVRRLDPRRWEVHLVCFRPSGAWFARAAERAASVTSFPIRSFRDTSTLSQMRAFAAWCRERRIALVHTSELYSNIFFLPAAALARVPVRIGSRRELTMGKTPGQLLLQRLAYGCAHRIVACAGKRSWPPTSPSFRTAWISRASSHVSLRRGRGASQWSRTSGRRRGTTC
jgi:hypothetical protein